MKTVTEFSKKRLDLLPYVEGEEPILPVIAFLQEIVDAGFTHMYIDKYVNGGDFPYIESIEFEFSKQRPETPEEQAKRIECEEYKAKQEELRKQQIEEHERAVYLQLKEKYEPKDKFI